MSIEANMTPSRVFDASPCSFAFSDALLGETLVQAEELILSQTIWSVLHLHITGETCRREESEGDEVTSCRRSFHLC